MTVRSSPAATKAMHDGDFVEASHCSVADGETTTHCPSTMANIGDASMVGHARHRQVQDATQEEKTIVSKSTRTSRGHLLDGKPLLRRQRAEVWNRPSVSRPNMHQRYDDDDASAVSSLSLQTLDSFRNYTMSREISCLIMEDKDDQDDDESSLLDGIEI